MCPSQPAWGGHGISLQPRHPGSVCRRQQERPQTEPAQRQSEHVRREEIPIGDAVMPRDRGLLGDSNFDFAVSSHVQHLPGTEQEDQQVLVQLRADSAPSEYCKANRAGGRGAG